MYVCVCECVEGRDFKRRQRPVFVRALESQEREQSVAWRQSRRRRRANRSHPNLALSLFYFLIDSTPQLLYDTSSYHFFLVFIHSLNHFRSFWTASCNKNLIVCSRGFFVWLYRSPWTATDGLLYQVQCARREEPSRIYHLAIRCSTGPSCDPSSSGTTTRPTRNATTSGISRLDDHCLWWLRLLSQHLGVAANDRQDE